MDPPRYDVFLSYNRADEALVARLAERLHAAGLAPWLDTWRLTPGEHWQGEIEGVRPDTASAPLVGHIAGRCPAA